jgi:lipoprotein-releasing system ATP-binding protein
MKLEIRNLNKSFVDASRKLTIIEGLSVSLPEKGSVAIIGRSGIGKSTLLHLLAGLETADSGEIIVGDTNLSQLSSDEVSRFRGNNIGVIFQFHHLLGDFSALENVALPLLISGRDEAWSMIQAEHALTRVGLKDRMHHSPGELSGGESQRVAIARALVGKPGLVVADEPTGNLDITTAQEIGGLLREIQHQEGMLLIAVTHSLELAQNMDFVFEMLPGGALKSLDKETISRGWKPTI